MSEPVIDANTFPVIGEVIGGGTFTVAVTPREPVPQQTGPVTVGAGGVLVTEDAPYVSAAPYVSTSPVLFTPILLAPAPASVLSVTASPANGVLHSGDTVTFTLAMSSAVTVSGGTPTLTLNDGGTAVYDAAATAALGDPTKLVFSYKAAVSDWPVDGLSFVRGSYNSASIVDATGQTPDFSAVYTSSFAGLQVETSGPTKVTLFAGTDGNKHVNLWVTDGTSAGTSELSVANASVNGLKPTSFVSLGTKVAFIGTDSANHQGLWISDGTAGGTSEFYVPGTFINGLASATLVKVGDKVILSGIDAQGNRNAWVTDGTAGGTLELPATNPTNFTQVGGKVFFSGVDQLGLRNIWVTDGTASGTSELMVPGSSTLDGSGFTALGNKILFRNNGDLWITDGTGAGTSRLSVTGVSSGYGLSPTNIVSLGNKALFLGLDSGNHTGIWVTDGTAAGTSELSIAGSANWLAAPGQLTVLGNKALFVANDVFWVTDGTSAGTSQLQIAGMGDPSGMTLFGGKLLFQANGNLWITDGTVAGTSILSAGGMTGNPYFSVSGNEVLFQRVNAGGQLTLWKTDGTTAGTLEVPVAGETPVFVAGRDFATTGNQSLFVGANSTGRETLWVTDGTNAGTSELSASMIFSYLADTYVTYHPYFTAFGTKVLFADGPALAVSDGTAAGTHLVSVTGAYNGGGLFYDLTGSGRTNNDPQFTVLGSRALFRGLDAAGFTGLWVTDGTSAGTSELSVAGAATSAVALGPIGLAPSAFELFGNQVLFTGQDNTHTSGLWITDGTSAGTSELAGGVSAFGHGTVGGVTVLGNKAVFVATNSSNQRVLGVTDGTAAGTSEIAVAGVSATSFNPRGLTALGNNVLFSGVDAAGNSGIWSTDGTSAGTSELFSGLGSAPNFFAQLGGKVVFTGAGAQPDLWVSDGTVAGTTEFYIPGSYSTNSILIGIQGNQVLFWGMDTSGRYNLFASDGTLAGTSELSVAGAYVGPSGGGLFSQSTSRLDPSAVSFGGKTYFAGRDTNGLVSLFVTDGTSAGSYKIVVNGAAATGLNPTNLTVVNGKIVFDGLDASGRGSLWTSDGTTAGTVEMSLTQPGSLAPGPFAPLSPQATVLSFTGSPASGIVHAGDTVTFTMTLSRGVTVSGGTPTLTLNDGGIAVYNAAATAALGDPARMVFSYTVGASDLPENGLSFVRGDQNGAVIVDSSGQGPDFSGAFATSFSGLQIATAPTAVTSVVASPSNGVEHPGDTVTFTITMNRAVTISGGTPTLTLNDGGVASYDAVATAALGDPTRMVFSYTVGTSDLPVDGLSFVRGDQNGAVIVDGAGRGPDFSAVFAALFSGIQISPAAPGVVTAGPEIQAASGAVVAELANGNFASAWLEGSAVHAQILSPDGTKVGGESIAQMPILTMPGLGAHPSVTALTNGGFAVVWGAYDAFTALNGVEVQLFASNGAPTGTAFQANTEAGQLNLGLNTSGVQVKTPTVTALADGGFVATWTYDDVRSPIATSRSQIFDANGARIGNEIVAALDKSDGASPAISWFADGSFVAVWNQLNVQAIVPGPPPGELVRPGFTAQIFDAQGNKISAEIAVNSNSDLWNSSNPSVAVLPTGGFVVTWEEQRNNGTAVTDAIVAQQFDAGGTKVGSQFHVDATVAPVNAFVASQPKVTALADGNFAILWQDASSVDASASVVKVRLFDAYQQSPVGSEVVINVQASQDQVHPALVALQDGGFAIAWGDANGEKTQIYAANQPVTTIASGATLEIPAASSAKLAFAPGGASLQLDQSTAFTGAITGFDAGDGIDLADIAFSGAGTTLGYAANASNSGGHLAVSDGTHIAALTLLGQYSATSFVLSADGHGGTLISAAAPDAAGQPHLAAPV
ncbi:beta strand repeat-containing protein [Bradyrhizobium ganzhouense]|uniref:beta strand repeat-containing protein n=1 Tax=Bradyrhizobium ganzhouense TaxID=1179767 RepID=UPI003CE9E4A0